MVSMKLAFLVHHQCIQNKATTVYLFFYLSFFYLAEVSWLNLRQEKEMFFFKQWRPVLVPNWNPWVLSPGLKRLGFKDSLSHSCTAQVKNVWNHISMSPKSSWREQ
jgi:hypothetical protein